MKNKLLEKFLTLKSMVAMTLTITLVSMGIIILIGVGQMDRLDSGIEDDKAGLVAEITAPQVTEQIAGGEDGTPVVKLTINPDRVVPGGSSVIAWEASGADSCEASGAWSGVKSVSGNQDSGPLSGTSVYILVCRNGSGETKIEGTVSVDAAVANSTAQDSSNTAASTPTTTDSSSSSSPSPTPSPSASPAPSSTTPTPSGVAPSLTLSVSPSSITNGASATLSWSMNANVSPAPTCIASGGWSGAKSPSGSASITPSTTTSYTLACTNTSGTSTKTVSVTVSAPVSSCGSGGSCTSAEVATRTSPNDCWVIIKYTASGGNGTNGQVYKISSNFFGSGGQHDSFGPSISANSWCGKNISSTFNSKHSGGSRSDGTNSAIWWLTNNGNSLIGPYAGS